MTKTFSDLNELASALGYTKNNKELTIATNDNTLVYSTSQGRIKATTVQKNLSSDGVAKVRRETKGRKGKGVITISGLGLDDQALKVLAKKLKKTCGTGGSVVNDVIEIQGDKRETIKHVLEQEHFKVKFVGG